MRVHFGLILVAAAMTAMPASAAVSDAERERVAACFEAGDWPCAFDGVVEFYQAPGAIENCLANAMHGCDYEMVTVIVSGIGAAKQAGTSDRRMIAERALDLLKPMSRGLTEGEIAFSALRYDACKAVDDQACMAESADLMRLANASGYGGEDSLTDMAWLLGEFGVQHSLDLALVMKEVAGMEKQE
jgi:hypothetical protein